MEIVFDASALLVLLNKEQGHQVVESYLPQAIISAVNLAEVITVLMSTGMTAEQSTTIPTSLVAKVIPFNTELATQSAVLRGLTKSYGLSLGDRACLALAQQKQLPVITADRVWKQLNLPIEIIFVR